MPACVVTPLFVRAAQRVQDMPEDTIRKIVDGFLGGVPMATLTAQTGVPNEVLNHLFKLGWREALTASGRQNTNETVSAVEQRFDPALVKVVSDLMTCRIPKDTIRAYMLLKPSVFEVHWKAAHEERRRARVHGKDPQHQVAMQG